MIKHTNVSLYHYRVSWKQTEIIPHKIFRPRMNQENSVSRGHLRNQVGNWKVPRRYAMPADDVQDCSALWACQLEGHSGAPHFLPVNPNNSKQCLLYLVVLLLLAVDGRQQAIAFKAPSLLWHNVIGHLFSFFCLTHHGQNLSLQNHSDFGLEGTWLSPYQIKHSLSNKAFRKHFPQKCSASPCDSQRRLTYHSL